MPGAARDVVRPVPALEALATDPELHVSELARTLRLSRQAVQATVAKLDRAGLVDVVREAGRLYAAPSEDGIRRIAHCRTFTAALKSEIELHLTAAQRHRLIRLLEGAHRALIAPRLPEWWLQP